MQDNKLLKQLMKCNDEENAKAVWLNDGMRLMGEA